MATFGTGLFMVGLDGQLLRNVRAVPAVGAGLAHNAVRHLYRDHVGLSWAATSLGVSHHDPRYMHAARMDAARMSLDASGKTKDDGYS